MSEEKRIRLAEIGKIEGELKLKGNTNLSGKYIEKYLAPFRSVLNKNGNTKEYSDLNHGFSWCGVFIHYCCEKAGFKINTKPDPFFRYTLAAVPAWHNWALKNGLYFKIDGSEYQPDVGDIVLYNKSLEPFDLYHIGIVINIENGHIISSEGNVNNSTGIFKRNIGPNINGFLRLNEG